MLKKLCSLVIAAGITFSPGALFTNETKVNRPVLEQATERPSKKNLEERVKKETNNPLNPKKEYKYNPKDFEKYQSWIKQCINHSKNKNFCLIIDKAAHEMDIYQNGKKITTYPIELGFNPYDDKQVEGDGCTPEGIYEIKGVKNRSQFHKALCVDYPNAQDRREFNQLKKERIITKDDAIGGGIQIHGLGSEKEVDQRDWTLGCIALSNKNIDELFDLTRPSKNRKKIKTAIVKYGTRKNY